MKLFAGWTLAFFAATALAQQSKHDPVGSVQGHVLCADTQRPARLAQVKLVRVPGPEDVKANVGGKDFEDSLPGGNVVETSLDGSYTIRNVKPGSYFVVVDKEGYLLPLGQFTRKELTQPNEGTKQRLTQAVRAITVQADQATAEDIVLTRGASVSGTVNYDDGSPASGIGITLLKKDAAGKWTAVLNSRYRSIYTSNQTDDYGRYRITGLPAGEYATEADLALSDSETSSGPMPGNPSVTVQFMMSKTRFSLPLYSGDVLRKPDAKAYSLGSGEALAGSDLVFPLARLHKVSGQVLAKDGHPVNGGTVKLVYPNDKTEMTEADVQFDDRIFQMEYVPEGDFLLQVEGAKDVGKVQVENPIGYTPRTREEPKTLKTFPDAEQAITVKGDSSDVVIQLPDTKASK